MPKHRTEEVYDTEMSPLIAQLIAIAKRERIPLLVSAGMLLNEDHHGNVHDEPTAGTCDTLILHGRNEQDPRLMGRENRLNLAHGVVRGHGGFDIAAGLVISRYHPADHPAAKSGGAE